MNHVLPETNAPANFDLEKYVPYLLNLAGGRLANATAAALKRTSIKYEMWRVLMTLWHHGALHLVQVARLSNFRISTLSRVVTRCEERGLVQRLENRGTNRTPKIDLTAKGRKLVADSLGIFVQREKAALEGLTEGQRVMLLEMLQRICRNAERYAISVG